MNQLPCNDNLLRAKLLNVALHLSYQQGKAVQCAFSSVPNRIASSETSDITQVYLRSRAYTHVADQNLNLLIIPRD